MPDAAALRALAESGRGAEVEALHVGDVQRPLPDCFDAFPRLRRLQLGQCGPQLPPSVGRLGRLESVRVVAGALLALPEGLCRAPLRTLQVWDAPLRQLPEGLDHLEGLSLAGCRALQHLPELGPKLLRLDLRHTGLRALPTLRAPLAVLRIDGLQLDTPLALPESVRTLTASESRIPELLGGRRRGLLVHAPWLRAGVPGLVAGQLDLRGWPEADLSAVLGGGDGGGVGGRGGPEWLDVSAAPRLSEITGLSGLRTLRANACPALVQVAGLPSVEAASLVGSPALRALADLPALRSLDLSLRRGPLPSGIEALHALDTLRLRGCGLQARPPGLPRGLRLLDARDNPAPSEVWRGAAERVLC